MPNISWVSRSCQAAPAKSAVSEGTGTPSVARVRSSTERRVPGSDGSMRWQTTSKPGSASASVSSTAVRKSKKA